ncbi:CocE/NonD family hydrolase [Parapedobacter tibetensis]|uniref:CocE/NonD family hydrolase n=1 Tax=Parapedobacter tibetensis TaxID=2972951 RepID=UPI00214DD35F|nr:CocE/NonD family hydrolase [Parapedobacter tibetensis]
MKSVYFLVVFALYISLGFAQNDHVKTHYDKTETYITMRDGVRLYTVIYSPKDKSQIYPILMQRTCYSAGPYGDGMKTTLGPNTLLMQDGYIFVYQDVRGRYMSEGEYTNMRPQLAGTEKQDKTAIDESTDTYDTIDWLVNNLQGHNGRVGLYGGSYPGFYAAAGALSNHPALKAASPQAPIGDFFFDDFHHNGSMLASYFFAVPVFGFQKDGAQQKAWYPYNRPQTQDSYDFFLRLGAIENGTPYQGEDNFFWRELLDHPNYDEFWQKRGLIQHLKDVKPAIMVVGGWFDAEDLYGPLHIYGGIEANSNNYNTIVMGPWSHGDWIFERGKQQIGDIYFGDSLSTAYQRDIEFRFFDHFLKGSGDPASGLPEAHMFDTGKKQWRNFEQWPPAAATDATLYLQPNGKLAFSPPTIGDQASGFTSDPMKPVPYAQSQEVVFTPRSYMTSDQRENARRPDVLVFETDTLTEDITLSGHLLAKLWVSTSSTDADWVVKLIDVLPGYTQNLPETPTGTTLSNYHMLVRGDIMPGRFRNSFETPEAFTPNTITEVPVKLQDIYHTFKKGHRIQVQIQSTWFPLFDRNPQKFVENPYKAKPEDYTKAEHQVYHDVERPSHITVQVLK